MRVEACGVKILDLVETMLKLHEDLLKAKARLGPLTADSLSLAAVRPDLDRQGERRMIARFSSSKRRRR